MVSGYKFIILLYYELIIKCKAGLEDDTAVGAYATNRV